MADQHPKSDRDAAPEDKPGLLQPAPAMPAPPDEYKVYEPLPQQASVDEMAGASHHGVIRERGPKLGREEEAKLVLEHTIVTPAVAWVLTLCFLLTIFSVPMLQYYVETRRNMNEQPQRRILPQIFDAAGELPDAEQIRAVRSPQQAWQLIPHADNFKRHETDLENNSVVVQFVLPRMQSLLTKHGGVGNEQAYVGVTDANKHRWLMYRPDVDYLTSRGFLDPALLTVRKRAGDAETTQVQPDPERAIVDFQRQLKARGIQLIVMPVPVKPMIHPERLSARYRDNTGVLQNLSYRRFQQELERQGVVVYDITQPMLEDKLRRNKTQFLETDTHWTPEAVDAAAMRLAELVGQRIVLPLRVAVSYTREPLEVGNFGDIAAMLSLPAGQRLFGPQHVMIQQVKMPDGKLWRVQRGADVLLLGDSFSNIYSSRASFPTEGSYQNRGWGEAAGFGEQISFYLKRPLDAIINNAGGSHVTREEMVRQMNQNPQRFTNTKLVIWEFSMRDLLIGDWKLLKLPAPQR